MDKKTLLTVGDIARLYGLRRDRVSYAVSKHGYVESERAGIIRLFTAAQAGQIAESTKAIRRG